MKSWSYSPQKKLRKIHFFFLYTELSKPPKQNNPCFKIMCIELGYIHEKFKPKKSRKELDATLKSNWTQCDPKHSFTWKVEKADIMNM